MICAAMVRWQPIASMVTTAPCNSSNCNNSGIAVISFDLFATLHCPSTSRCCELHAEIIWIGPCSAARSNERRNVFPSTATTPRTAVVNRSTQAMKQL